MEKKNKRKAKKGVKSAINVLRMKRLIKTFKNKKLFETSD